jgi:hypothetical protein
MIPNPRCRLSISWELRKSRLLLLLLLSAGMETMLLLRKMAARCRSLRVPSALARGSRWLLRLFRVRALGERRGVVRRVAAVGGGVRVRGSR